MTKYFYLLVVSIVILACSYFLDVSDFVKIGILIFFCLTMVLILLKTKPKD